MARWSSPEDVNRSKYQKMPEEFHEEAEDYINNMIIRASGHDPADIVGKPYELKQISVLYAMEKYAAESFRGANDGYWAEQRDSIMDEREKMERKLDIPRLFGGYNYQKNRRGGISSRKLRV